jgi:hypothetical protein
MQKATNKFAFLFSSDLADLDLFLKKATTTLIMQPLLMIYLILNKSTWQWLVTDLISEAVCWNVLVTTLTP